MKKRTFILGLIATAQLSLIGCSDNDASVSDTPSTLQTEVLTNLSLDVITETYGNLYNNALTLHQTAENFTIGDEQALQELKNAWKNTRAPWEKSEGFLYGPVVNKGIDPAIDSWPVDVNAINSILESSEEITSSLLENNNTARGFHTIEYFVWGIDGNKSAADFTAREIEYLIAATENLKEKTHQLYMGWNNDGEYFASNFIDAGENSSIYRSKANALKEMAEGLAIIADEVANGKIETPLNGDNGGAKPEAEESRFSHNSKLDFANNIRSIQNIYLGNYDGAKGKGLTAVVVKANATLDSNIKTAITDAITAIETIPGTFTQAIVNNRTAVENAQNKVSELHLLLQSKLLPLVSEL